MSKNVRQPNIQKTNTLYWFVFNSVFSKCFTFAFFIVFTVLPAAPVFADEVSAMPEAPPATEPDPVPVIEVAPEPEPAVEEQVDPVEIDGEAVSDDSDEESEDDEVEEVTDDSGIDSEVFQSNDTESGVSSDSDTDDGESDAVQTVEDSISLDEDVTDSPADTVTESSNSNQTQSGGGSAATPIVEGVATSTIDATDRNTPPASTTVGASIDSASSTDGTTSENTNNDETFATSSDSEISEPDPVLSQPVDATEDDNASTTPDNDLLDQTDAVSQDEIDVSEDTSSTTEQSAMPPPVIVASVTNDENRHQFSETECVSVGDGSYYCSKLSAKNDNFAKDVFSARDSDGDLEIFINEGGEPKQLTHNKLDDAAPHLDTVTNELVFHRLIEGRYQIMHLDLNTGEETQLTDTRENNMEPQQAGGIIVWQRWVTDNWEIALYKDGVTKIITNNSYHDVAPTARDGFVMWHTTSVDGEKMLTVYEIDTGETTLVSDPDGGHVENPRFVLVYDTEYENGDVVTKEYDPETGSIRPLGSDPAPLPPQLPEPDSTGETRALIQNKTNTGKDEITEIITKSASSTSINNGSTTAQKVASSSTDVAADQVSIDQTTSTSTSSQSADQATLDLTKATTSSTLELSDYDLIIEPYEAVSTTSVSSSTSTDSSAS